MGPLYNWTWMIVVTFYSLSIHSDAGEDEGDLDFSALLKAAKK